MGKLVTIDSDVESFKLFFASQTFDSLQKEIAVETVTRLHRRLLPTKTKYTGAEAASYLERLIKFAQDEILDQDPHYGAIRWLWYLRHVPDFVFAGTHGTTLGRIRLLSEVISARFSDRDLVATPSRHTAFPINDEVCYRVARFVVQIVLLDYFHILYKKVGKGGVLDTSNPMCFCETTAAVTNAIRIYDVRNDRRHEFTDAGLGIAPLDLTALADFRVTDDPMPMLLIGLIVPEPGRLTAPVEGGAIDSVNVEVRYMPMKLCLRQVLKPINNAQGIPRYLSDIAPILQLLMLVPILIKDQPGAMISMMQFGYACINEEQLRKFVSLHLPKVVELVAPLSPGYAWPEDYDRLHSSLLEVTGSDWPLQAGNFVRQCGEAILLDVCGASHGILHRLEQDRDPQFGNIRAKQFELECQAIINGSAWEPPPGLKEVIGRTLCTFDGNDVTDIDALGVRGKTLLIVSCKSLIYDRQYDKGVFNVIRNTEDVIVKALEKWDAVAEELTQRPIGANYNFSDYEKVIGVVCTPFVVYSSHERALAFVQANLRACSSIFELRDWLIDNVESGT